MDLLSYLRAYEPNNLLRVGGSVYCTREHDSLKIPNGKWYWWSRGIGGVSDLDYLIKVKDYGFVEAVEALAGGAVEWTPPQTSKKRRTESSAIAAEAQGLQPSNAVSFRAWH